jgi:hypothetical protein
MFKLKCALLVIVLVSILSAPSFAQVKVYDNTANLSSQSYVSTTSICYGEFIHLDSAAPITAIDLGYYCPEGVYGGGMISLEPSLDYNAPLGVMGPIYQFGLTPGTNGIVHFDLGTDPATNPFYNWASQDVFLRVAFSTDSAGILTADSAGIGTTDVTAYQASWGPPAAYSGVTSTATLDGKHLAIALYTTPVPEPGTFAVLGSGLVGLLAFRRRRK